VNKSEVVRLGQLCKALPGCEVFTQVALAALIQPPANWPDAIRQASWRGYEGSVMDFMIWVPVAEKVLRLVEPQSRGPAEEGSRDILRDAIPGEAGYSLVRLHGRENFSKELLRARISDAIDLAPNVTVWTEERDVRQGPVVAGLEIL
jgi:hypothetical protein